VAATQQQDDFDVLKFFITVMVLLTVIVAGFAGVLEQKVSDTTRRIKAEIATLHQMDELARDPAFREWIAREREGRNTGQGSSADFKALLNDHATKTGLKVTESSELGAQELGNGTRELTFRLRIQGCRVEALMRFLVSVEQDWPGSKVREITDLSLDEKNQVWNAQVILAIFKHTEQAP
jgi:hypothetical protein